MVDREAHARLAGIAVCEFCSKTIQQGVGIIQFPNGFQAYTHKACFHKAVGLVYLEQQREQSRAYMEAHLACAFCQPPAISATENSCVF